MSSMTPRRIAVIRMAVIPRTTLYCNTAMYTGRRRRQRSSECIALKPCKWRANARNGSKCVESREAVTPGAVRRPSEPPLLEVTVHEVTRPRAAPTLQQIGFVPVMLTQTAGRFLSNAECGTLARVALGPRWIERNGLVG